MKDFDFDELDRAVNSVLTQKSNDGGQQDDAVVNDDNSSSPVNDSVTDNTNSNTSASDDTSVSDHDNGSTDVGQGDEHTNESFDQVDQSPSEDTHQSQDDETQTDNNTTDGEQGSGNTTESFDDNVQPTDNSEVTSDHNLPNENDQNSYDDNFQDQPTETHQAFTNSDNDENSLGQPDEAASESVNNDNPAPTSAPQLKRGRFMDMVSPSNDVMANKPFSQPTRSGVTMSPTAGFSVPDFEKAQAVELEPETQYIDEAPEPSPTESIKQAATDVTYEQPISNVENPSAEQGGEVVSANDSSQTPFIPDVPVEKRPLNPGIQEQDKPDDNSNNDNDFDHGVPSVNPESAQDTSVTAEESPVPKEFNKEIMAVEANETIGEAVENPEDQPNKMPGVNEEVSPHPMFDTSTYNHPHGAAAHPVHSKLMWIIIAGSLFLVGAVLGVLYFIYGQA